MLLYFRVIRKISYANAAPGDSGSRSPSPTPSYTKASKAKIQIDALQNQALEQNKVEFEMRIQFLKEEHELQMESINTQHRLRMEILEIEKATTQLKHETEQFNASSLKVTFQQ